MDDAERLRLLNAVAAGELSPEAAAARLRDLAGRESHPHDAAAAGDSTHGVDDPVDDVDRVEIHVNAARVTVVADPEVDQVEVDGPHRLERHGGATVVKVESRSRAAIGALRTGRRSLSGWTRRSTVQATIRVPTSPALEVHANAAALRVSRLSAPLALHGASSFVRIREATGPLDISLHACRLHLGARLSDGSSTIRLNAASATIDLDPDSHLTVDSSIDLGSLSTRLHLDERPGRSGHFTIGSGTGHLDIRGAVSSVVVRCGVDETRVA